MSYFQTWRVQYNVWWPPLMKQCTKMWLKLKSVLLLVVVILFWLLLVVQWIIWPFKLGSFSTKASNLLLSLQCFHIWDLDARGFHKGMWRLFVKRSPVFIVGVPASPYSWVSKTPLGSNRVRIHLKRRNACIPWDWRNYLIYLGIHVSPLFFQDKLLIKTQIVLEL